MMNCDIIRDLMPLYADGLTCEASSRQIEEHIRICPACRRLRDEMCAPMESESTDDEQKIINVLRIQKRKQRLRAVLPWILAVLFCTICWWIYMETHFYGEEIVTVSTDEREILEEMPALALTDGEIALADTILEIDLFRDALRDDPYASTVFEIKAVQNYISSILPEDAVIVEVAAIGTALSIDYRVGDLRTIIEYIDADLTGHVDAIRKHMAHSPREVIGGVEFAGDVDEVYSLTYGVGSGLARYEKTEAKHDWFSFLNRQ